MTLLDTVRNFFVTGEGDYGYAENPEGAESSRATDYAPREGRVVSVDSQKQHKLTIYSPRSFSDVEYPAQDIKRGIPTLVNFHRLKGPEAERVSHFLQGVVFALNGEFTQVAEGTMAFAPHHTGIDNKGDLGGPSTVGGNPNQGFFATPQPDYRQR